MNLIKKAKSPKDTYIWIEQYQNLSKIEQTKIKTAILKNQYPIFLTHVEQLAKYQLINKLNELFDIFSNDSDKKKFFDRFGSQIINKTFWLNLESATNHIINNYIEKYSIFKYSNHLNNYKILYFFYSFTNYLLQNNLDIQVVINYLQNFNLETRYYLLNYQFDFPNINLGQQSFLMVLLYLNRNSDFVKIFTTPNLLSNNKKQKLLTYFDEHNNSLIHAAIAGNNITGLQFIISNIRSIYLKKNLIIKTLAYSGDKVFKNNGLSVLHIAMIQNNPFTLSLILSVFNSKEQFNLIINHKVSEYSLHYASKSVYELSMLQYNPDIFNVIAYCIPIMYTYKFKTMLLSHLLTNTESFIDSPYQHIIFHVNSYININNHMLNRQKTNEIFYHKNLGFKAFYETEAEKANEYINEIIRINNLNIKTINKIKTLLDSIKIIALLDIKSQEKIDLFATKLKSTLTFISTDDEKINELISEIIEDILQDSIEEISTVQNNLELLLEEYSLRGLLINKLPEQVTGIDEIFIQKLINHFAMAKKNISFKNLACESALNNNKHLIKKSISCFQKHRQHRDPVVFFIDFNDTKTNVKVCRSSESLESLTSPITIKPDASKRNCKTQELIEPFLKLHENNISKIMSYLKKLNLCTESIRSNLVLAKENKTQSLLAFANKFNCKISMK
tara:strand:- start:5398 stop:7422 length:2025 start_codon:yes stop_codon:yes gene_type:complete